MEEKKLFVLGEKAIDKPGRSTSKGTGFKGSLDYYNSYHSHQCTIIIYLTSHTQHALGVHCLFLNMSYFIWNLLWFEKALPSVLFLQTDLASLV